MSPAVVYVVRLFSGGWLSSEGVTYRAAHAKGHTCAEASDIVSASPTVYALVAVPASSLL